VDIKQKRENNPVRYFPAHDSKAVAYESCQATVNRLHPVSWVSNAFRNHQLSCISMSAVEMIHVWSFHSFNRNFDIPAISATFQASQRTPGVLLPAFYPLLGTTKVDRETTFHKL